MKNIKTSNNKKKFLSIVIPVCNSEKTIKKIYEKLLNVFENTLYEFELIMVEDHSKDRSWSEIEFLTKKDSRVRGIKLAKNFGQHASTLCGINLSKGDFVVTIDDDLEQPPEKIIDLLIEIENGYDVVYGILINRTDSLWRRTSSRVIKLILNLLMPGFKNYSSMRVIRGNIAKQLSNFDSPYPIIDGYLTWLTNNYSAVEIKHRQRKVGKSNYSFKSLLYLSKSFIIGFSEGPIQIVSILGIFLSLIGIFFALYIIFQKIVGITIVYGYASIMSSILVMGGLQLFLIGIFGEYIARINSSTSRKPLFVISIDTKSGLLK